MVISVINSSIGLRKGQVPAIILTVSVILGTQDLGKVGSLVDDGTIEKNKKGRISARSKVQGGG